MWAWAYWTENCQCSSLAPAQPTPLHLWSSSIDRCHCCDALRRMHISRSLWFWFSEPQWFKCNSWLTCSFKVVVSVHDLLGDTGRRGGVSHVPSMERCIAHLMLSCTLSDVSLFFLLFRNSFFRGGWSALRLQWHDLPYPAPGAMETGLVDWTIGLITPSYGKLEICSSCLSWPMSVSVLLASIHSASSCWQQPFILFSFLYKCVWLFKLI
jgi:hypothetical protein